LLTGVPEGISRLVRERAEFAFLQGLRAGAKENTVRDENIERNSVPSARRGIVRTGAERMRPDLEPILVSARLLSPEELPRLLGDLEEIRATALARLTAPAPQTQAPDTLLDVDEAAARLGQSRSYLYRHHKRFPFTRHMGRSLRFSANGIEHFLRQRRA